MRAKGKSSSREKFFILLVSMATLIVMVMAVKVEVNKHQIQDQNQNEHQNQTDDPAEEKTFVNETGGHLTLDFDSGDLAAEREETKHQLTIIDGDYTSYRFVECRGENIKSISVLYCDSLETCEEHKSCLFGQSKCRLRWSVENGRKCTKYESGSGTYRSSYSDYDHDDDSESSCFRVQILTYSGHAGIVQCTSENENGENVTTFDHFTLNYSQGKLLSTIKNVTVDMIEMKIYVSSLVQDLNGNAISRDKNANVTLYVDEEVTVLECQVPKLLFHNKDLFIQVHKKDGSTMKLEPKMTSRWDAGEFMNVQLMDFRVPAEIVAFSCSAQRTNSSGQWLENWIKVTVQELPSELIVKSSECINMTVNLTSGSKVDLHCELNGPSHQKLTVKNEMRKMRENYNGRTEPKSTSVVEFVRFHQVAGEHLICKELDQASENSTWKTEHQKYYGDELRFHFIFNLAPSAPKIYKSLNQINSNSSVHLIYQEEHVVHQTLFCMFSGEPEPVISWMKNGQELFFMKSMGVRRTEDHKLHLTPGNETMEHVKLPLDAKTIQPSDFDLGENGNEKAGQVNFSCIARNKFGSDRLDFIITMPGDFAHHVESAASATRTTVAANFPVEHNTTSASSATSTEKTEILASSTTTILTSTAQSLKEEEGNLKAISTSNSTLSLGRSDGAKRSETFAIVGLVLLLSFICIAVFSAVWRKRNARALALFDQSRRILSFQNLVENDRNQSG